MRFGEYALSFLLSVAPAVLLLWLFVRIDRARPEPLKITLITLALGATACIPAALVELALHSTLGSIVLVGGRLVDALVVVALTEEVAKLAVVLLFSYRRSVFDEVTDGIVYAAAASLGFGLVENLFYSLHDVRTGMLRAVTAIPMHAVATATAGYFVGRARFVSRTSAMALVSLGLGFAVVIHGAYDWMIFLRGEYWFALSLAVIVLGALLLATLVRSALRLDDAMFGRHSMTAMLRENWPTEVPSTIVPDEPKPVPSAVQPIDPAKP